jgi:ribosomal protein S20
MSVSGVSGGTSNTAAYQTNTQQKDVRNVFKQMSDAINSGDLQDAQNAFDSLASLLNNGQQQTTSSSSQTSSNGSDFSNLLNQIGSALQSGDLDQAKQALTNLQQSAQAGRGGHRHHHHHGGGGAVGGVSGSAAQTATATTSASTDTSSTGTVDLSV